MKGIAHFVTGLAVATCFAQIVHGASQSLSFVPLLGGVAGLLPDTLDFRLARFFERPEVEVDPAHLARPDGHPDALAMAERIAEAVDRAWEIDRPVRLRLHTLKVGADRWRQYTVVLGSDSGEVTVQLGPVVTTAQVPYPGSEVPGLGTGAAQASHRIRNLYASETVVDIFDGPSLAFARSDDGDDVVEATFLPWHRVWTHSLAMALALGIVGWLVAPACGVAMGLATIAHLMEDQMGFLGSSLFWPISRRRVRGLQLFHSGDVLPNLLAVWIGLAVILLNLDRFSSAPAIPVLPYLLGTVGVPCLLLISLGAWQALRSKRSKRLGLAGAGVLEQGRKVDT